MPLGKYYCDYCDKEFQDTPAARRRHLQGIQHQRAKALWYNSLLNPLVHNDPESFGKGVCNRFVRTGSCQYGESCRYYHPKQNTQNMNLERIRGTISFVFVIMHPLLFIAIFLFPSMLNDDHFGWESSLAKKCN
nr:zinc finger CCCH domain-containing protein 3 isoform X1 [Ipomoea batatas]